MPAKPEEISIDSLVLIFGLCFKFAYQNDPRQIPAAGIVIDQKIVIQFGDGHAHLDQRFLL